MTVGDVPLDRGVCLSLGTLKTAKGPQSRAPSAHPLGFFLVVQGICCSYLLTCACMLRYSVCYAVPMLFYFFTFSVILFWQGARMLRYSARYTLPILFRFTFGKVPVCFSIQRATLCRCCFISSLSP